MYPSPDKDFPEVDQLRSNRKDISPESPVELPSQKRRRRQFFLPALSFGLFARLASLPGKALAVYLVVLQRSRVKRTNPVGLSSTYLKQFGLTRWDKSRSLTVLENAGLIRVEKRGRRNPLVHLTEEIDDERNRS